MTSIIFIALSIVPLSALVTGALFFHYRKLSLHVPSFVIFGLLAMYVDFHFFYRAYQSSFALEQWEPAATTMGMYSVLVTLNCFVFGLLGAVIYSLFSQLTKKQDSYSQLSFGSIAAISILAVVTGTAQIKNHQAQSEGQKLYTQVSGALSPELVADVLRIDQTTKDKTLITALLQNPACPPSVLIDYAQKSEVLYRATVLKNPNVPANVIEKLAQDKNEVVRYQVVLNPKTTTEMLQQLTKDPAKDVRLKAQAVLEHRQGL